MDEAIKQRVALKAVIVNGEGKMLVLREANTYADGTNLGKYDVPGGRLEPGEAWHDGLLREVREETGLAVELVKPLIVGEWRPVINGVTNQIVGIFMLCKLTGSDAITLDHEHDSYVWMSQEEIDKYNLLPATRDAANAYFAKG
jgi:8-oxo-dGTP diphosphatase